jgi:hypothetical protein
MSSNSIKPLALLRDFSNIDKHQQICKMSIPPGGMKFNSQFADRFHKIVQEGFLPGYYIENVIIDASHFNTDIYEFGTKLSFPRDRFDNIGDVSIVLTTQDGHIVMEILNILFNTVHAIISEFEKSFFHLLDKPPQSTQMQRFM